ncbi:neurotransmitter:Na+ symporter, NSS family [Cetobacterium ceti]|uniref:Transporter n=1 Tax=Cetobacterium ceti TaxID=180163 RepID=A0A1T4LH88_9FUSO|nr:sodium-dependent transporter [Cetobacterium ceti]SJZ53951.1 neurotransmitter:Na+ symporter, NSS family [Cetobacterium ceti]
MSELNLTNVDGNSRGQWKSTFGFVMAAAGSAIGLGNLWKFPYLAGKNGGGAFVIIYLSLIIIVGFSLVLAEMSVGRKGQTSAYGSFKKINGKFGFIGMMGVITSFIILSYYSVIGGWILKYIGSYFLGGIPGNESGNYFTSLISSPLEPLGYHFIFIFVTALIVLGGIEKGIERASKFMMPALFVLLIFVSIRSVTLPGAMEGIKFFLKPDFSKITLDTFVAALGQVFFSLSLGMGVMVTYGSYLKKDGNMPKDSLTIPFIDTLIAMLSGFAILPAVFALGFEPGQGPGLMFVTLPAVFDKMPMGSFFGIIFFILVLFAAITSSISLLETSVSLVVDQFKLGRIKAVILLGVVAFLLGVPSSLANGVLGNVHIFGKNFFDLMCFITDNILLPSGGLLLCLFVGYVWGPKEALKEITNNHNISFKLGKLWIFGIRYIAPVMLGIVLINCLK